MRGGGTRGGDCYKLRSCIGIEAGQTVTLADTVCPGMITHLWFTGYVGHSFILRIYWDNAEFPSVECPISAFFGCTYDENFKEMKLDNLGWIGPSMTITPPLRIIISILRHRCRTPFRQMPK